MTNPFTRLARTRRHLRDAAWSLLPAETRGHLRSADREARALLIDLLSRPDDPAGPAASGGRRIDIDGE